MSKKEDRTLKLIIGNLLFFAFVFAYSAMKIEVASWGLIVCSFLVFVAALFVVSHRGYYLGLGKFGDESILADNLFYNIAQVVKLGDRSTLLILMESKEHNTRAVVIPHGGFKNFEILDDKYIVPKGKGAKVMNGCLVLPARY